MTLYLCVLRLFMLVAVPLLAARMAELRSPAPELKLPFLSAVLKLPFLLTSPPSLKPCEAEEGLGEGVNLEELEEGAACTDVIIAR